MRKFVAALAVAVSLAACSPGDGTKSDAASGEQLVVKASFYPYAWAVEAVGGTHVDVENLTSPGAEPHDLEPTPRQVGGIYKADLVVFQHGFQPAIDTIVAQSGLSAKHRLDVDSVVKPVATDGAKSPDPHVWLDPKNMVVVVKAVEKSLSALAPSAADDFRANAAATITELTDLDRRFTTELATCAIRTIVTSHDAFGYLTRAYGLRQQPIAGLDPTQEPSSSQLATITKAVKAHGVTTVFAEELASPKLARAVARATGAKLAVLNPIEGLASDQSTDTYISLMTDNLQALAKASQCR